jgi:hypothetical protein
MRGLRRVLVWLIAFGFCLGVQAGPARIIKVLPHYLDRDGRHTRSPSLYERDAYQAHLRRHPELRSGLRFDIEWRAASARPPLKLRMELRTSQEHLTEPLILESEVKRSRWFSRWSALKVTGKQFQEMGQLIAWRATLWSGERQVAEQRSFLWQ